MQYTAYIDVHHTSYDTLNRETTHVKITHESPYIKDNAMNTVYFIHRALIHFASKNPNAIIYSVDVMNIVCDERGR